MIPLCLDSLDPCFNLAFEEHLCRTLPEGHPGWLLFWSNAASVIVGRFQNTAAEINAEYLSEHGIPVIRRMTGGGAVYHDEGNINFAFIIPRRSLLLFGNGFAGFLQPVVQAFRDLGLQAELSGRNDIVVSGSKCSGSAQHHTNRVVLHHGTILYDVNLDALEQALAGDPEKYTSKGLASVRSRVSNLKPLLKDGISKEDLVCAVAARCTGFSEVPDAHDELTDQDFLAAEQLAKEKYRTWDWNFGCSPDFNETRTKRFPWGKFEMLLDVRQGVITSCAFQGDFFFQADPMFIAKRLHGVPYRPDDVFRALEGAPLSICFTGCDPEALRAFIAGR